MINLGNKKTIYFIIFGLLRFISLATAQEETQEIKSVLAPSALSKPFGDKEPTNYGVTEYKNYPSDTIAQAKLDRYRNQKKFRYRKIDSDEFDTRSLNPIGEFFNSIFEILDKLFGFDTPKWVIELLKYLFYSLIILLSAYFLLRFFGIKVSLRPQKHKSKIDNISFEHIEENLEQIDFNHLIDQAIKEKKYRIAIRLFFLKSLQQLSNKEHISWSIDKTNNDYKYELGNSPLLENFTRAVYLFEYIWYGNFDLNENEFQRAMNSFQELQNMIANEE